MNKSLNSALFAMGLVLSSQLSADAIMVFESVDAVGAKSQETLSITQRWIRSETDSKEKYDYRLMDSGRFLMFGIDDDKKTFQTYRVGRIFWPESPAAPLLKPTKKKKSVSDVTCRVVNEMGEDGPIAEHCMVTTGTLGLSPRDIIVLSRFFMVDRTMGGDEIAIGSADERQISIYSKSLKDQRSRMLKSIINKPAPDKRMKIPDEYARLSPDIPRDLITDPEAYKKLLEAQKKK